MDIKEKFQCLIIGSETQSGLSLIRLLTERGIEFQVFDIRSPSDIAPCCEFIKATTVQYVVNCLFEDGYFELLDWQTSWSVFAREIAKAANETQKNYIQLSNANVFSGTSTRAYVEADSTDSNAALGACYAKVEQAALDNFPTSIVLRTGWLFSEHNGNFFTQLVEAAIRSESLVFSGRLLGNPTDANMVARVVLAMIEQLDCKVEEPLLSGVFHYADSDACSMHTFAKAVITAVKSMVEVRVESIIEGDSADMADAILETENYELGCKHILSTFGIKQRPWRRGIQDVLKAKF